MGIFFANPWGLLALLGVPAIVAIHLLRRRSRRVRVSTLFLVERALPSSEGGRRIRTLRHSLPLWVQILTVCALAWLLAQPRWISDSSMQTVVAIFDTSASMSAFREEILRAAEEELGRREAAAAHTRWIFLRSDASRLASGPDLPAALAEARSRWDPALGTHDTAEALRLGRTLAGEKGTLVFFTDRPPAKADGLSWIAVGEPIDNAGFVGGQATQDHWSALLKNFGPTARPIRWRIAGAAEWKTEHLEPGGMTEIAGAFPEGTDRVLLETAGDRFGFDDRIALLKPRPKPLTLAFNAVEPHREFFEPLAALADSTPLPERALPDVVLENYNPLAPVLPGGSAVIFVEDVQKTGQPLAGLLVAENHPLMENLNWQGLIARETFTAPFRDEDQVLLWQGARPLIFLRRQNGKPQLVFNFDVRRSNAARLPAFPLLLHRFFSLLREEKIAPAAANVETRQTLAIAGAGTVNAPERPDFFTVKTSAGEVLFEGAAQFGDVRESDFSAAGTGRGSGTAGEPVCEANARGQALDPMWAAALAGLMFWNWLLTGRPKNQPPEERS